MSSNNERLIAVRALTLNPGQHRELADEVVEADLDATI